MNDRMVSPSPQFAGNGPVEGETLDECARRLTRRRAALQDQGREHHHDRWRIPPGRAPPDMQGSEAILSEPTKTTPREHSDPYPAARRAWTPLRTCTSRWLKCGLRAFHLRCISVLDVPAVTTDGNRRTGPCGLTQQPGQPQPPERRPHPGSGPSPRFSGVPADGAQIGAAAALDAARDALAASRRQATPRTLRRCATGGGR